jgi:hypothetical protein
MENKSIRLIVCSGFIEFIIDYMRNSPASIDQVDDMLEANADVHGSGRGKLPQKR